MEAKLGLNSSDLVDAWYDPKAGARLNSSAAKTVRDNACFDLFDNFNRTFMPNASDEIAWLASNLLSVANTGVYMDRLTEALPPSTPSCEDSDGCPNVDRPLCKAGSCVSPACSDFAPLCNYDGSTGFLARALCSVTCGCDNPRSALFFAGASLGCPKACVSSAMAKAVELTAGCQDAESKTDRAALLAFATGPAKTLSMQSEWGFFYGAKTWEELGCLTLYFEYIFSKESGLCGQGINETLPGESSSKTFKAFCPATCADIAGFGREPSRCPRPSVELSGKALEQANDANRWGWTWQMHEAGALDALAAPQKVLPVNCTEVDMATCRDFERTKSSTHARRLAANLDATEVKIVTELVVLPVVRKDSHARWKCECPRSTLIRSCRSSSFCLLLHALGQYPCSARTRFF
jgi:hypothetical protein